MPRDELLWSQGAAAASRSLSQGRDGGIPASIHDFQSLNLHCESEIAEGEDHKDRFTVAGTKIDLQCVLILCMLHILARS